jgi:hypothetical protein
LVGVAVKMTGAPEQTGLEEADIVTPAERFELTVIVILLDVAGLPVIQAAFEVIIQVTISPFKGVYVKDVLLVPASTPFTFHWYVGVIPPLVGEAMIVVEEPVQTGLDTAAIVILAVRIGLTLIVTVLDVAGLPVGQVELEVITT